MILDKLVNLKKYVAMNPYFQQVVEYVENNDLAAHPAGKEVINGSDLFVNFALAKGKTKEQARLETHDQMLDIQIPINTAETMGYTPRADLPAQPYDADKDITFYDGLAEQYVTVHPGEFAIFFPQDGHAPCISDEPEIQKVIFKVRC